MPHWLEISSFFYFIDERVVARLYLPFQKRFASIWRHAEYERALAGMV